jgi:hypothetical protein
MTEPDDTQATDTSKTSDGGTDAYHEPENSTVDDWIGQRVQRDEALADELVEDADGDVAKAQSRFEQASDEGEEYRAAHDQTSPASKDDFAG